MTAFGAHIFGGLHSISSAQMPEQDSPNPSWGGFRTRIEPSAMLRELTLVTTLRDIKPFASEPIPNFLQQ